MISAARWRKCLREGDASLFILVQIQAGSPRFAPHGATRGAATRGPKGRGVSGIAGAKRKRRRTGRPSSISLNHFTFRHKPQPVSVLRGGGDDGIEQARKTCVQIL